MPGITFSCEDTRCQRLYDTAEAKMRENIRDFAGRKVLVEGAGYEKIWLETQPMGGEMNWFRHTESAKNNILLFMENIRNDGRMPGSIMLREGKIIPQYDKLQGFCFARPALRGYFYLLEEDRASGTNIAHDYLDNLRFCLEKFDAWLQKTRNIWNSGVLASFCVYDTGDDNALRYGDAPCYCTTDEPPVGYRSVPMMSMDVTGYSYACRDTLAKIAVLLGDEEDEKRWNDRKKDTRDAMIRYLWDEDKKACFDRYADGTVNPVLCHNTIRCMYHGILPEDMALSFMRYHLDNDREFRTVYPVPSVSVSDPLFRNTPDNNWSGQSQALTWQRLLDTPVFSRDRNRLEWLTERIFSAIDKNGCSFYQQYDPFTGIRGGGVDCYGPAILSVLRAFDMTRGIYRDGNRIILSTAKRFPFECTMNTPLHKIVLKCDGIKAETVLDNNTVLCFAAGERKEMII